MDKKKLKPTLPKDESEIFSKGYEGSVSESKKFVTDGHAMFLAEYASPEVASKARSMKREDVKGASEQGIQVVWDGVVVKRRVKAEFIGCCNLRSTFQDEDPLIVAVVRSQDRGCIGVNPWILAWCVKSTGADGLELSAGGDWRSTPLVLLRGETIVAMVMPMRLYEMDMKAYDLTGDAVGL